MTNQIQDIDRKAVRDAAVASWSNLCPCNSQLRRPSDPHADVCNAMAQAVADARGAVVAPVEGVLHSALAAVRAELEKGIEELKAALGKIRTELGFAKTELEAAKADVVAKADEIAGLKEQVATLLVPPVVPVVPTPAADPVVPAPAPGLGSTSDSSFVAPDASAPVDTAGFKTK